MEKLQAEYQAMVELREQAEQDLKVATTKEAIEAANNKYTKATQEMIRINQRASDLTNYLLQNR